jgi:molybdopterin synthase catalytic subunit
MTDKIKNVFRQGAIPPSQIAESIANHQHKTHIGAHYLFMGQVRADEAGNKKVAAIEYTAQETLANQIIHEIREAAFSKWDLSCMHIYHSLGKVDAGQICFVVFVSSDHREQPYEAVKYIVDRIKSEAPVFGKEIFEDGNHRWKENKA